MKLNRTGYGERNNIKKKPVTSNDLIHSAPVVTPVVEFFFFILRIQIFVMQY